MVERGVGSNSGRVMKFGFAKLIVGPLPLPLCEETASGKGAGGWWEGGSWGGRRVLGPASAPFAAGAPSM